MGNTPVTLDFSKAQPVAPPTSGPGVTLDFSKSQPLSQPAPTPEQALSRTNANMTAAMSGQPMPNPEDQQGFDAGKEAGMESAAAQTAATIGGELLLAPRAVAALSKVPAGRDAAGRMLPWIVKTTTEEGSSLAKAGFDALKAAGEAHPLVKQMIISGLGAMGAGKIAKALGWIGKATAEP